MLKDRLKQMRKARGMTLEELADAIGTSKQTIHRYENGIIANIPPEKVVALANALCTTPAELMGWVDEGIPAKNIYPVSVKRLPIIGEIACGNPIFANEEYEGFAITDGGIDADFCLRAHGDSMVGARINDGDIVFIKEQNEVNNGEIAAVILGDEATLKRVYFYPEEKKLVLSPENPRYAPLVYVKEELENIKIIGRAVAFQSIII